MVFGDDPFVSSYFCARYEFGPRANNFSGAPLVGGEMFCLRILVILCSRKGGSRWLRTRLERRVLAVTTFGGGISEVPLLSSCVTSWGYRGAMVTFKYLAVAK